MFDQKNDLYRIVVKYILEMPSVNIGRIPMFSSMFFSTSGELCRQSRLWILNVLVGAARGGVSEQDLDMLNSMSVIERLTEASINLNTNEDEFDKCLEILAQLPPQVCAAASISQWIFLVSKHSKFLKPS
jgi:hypothetical protein